MSIISARYKGQCKKCGAAVRLGEQVNFTRGVPGVTCLKCAPVEGPDLGQMFDMAYEDQCAEAAGVPWPGM